MKPLSLQDTLIGLLPPVSYAPNGERIVRQAKIDARALGHVQNRAAEALNAMQPNRAGDLLSDWERVLGLDGAGKSYANRLSDVLIKINAIGGLSIPYFIDLARAAGYTITISEPQPFRAGINRTGDRLAREDIMWVWVVNVQSQSQTVYRFRAGSSAAGERLSSYGDGVIETIFNDLKPAHTAVWFSYSEFTSN